MNEVTEDVVSVPGNEVIQISSRTLRTIPRVGEQIMTFDADREPLAVYTVMSVRQEAGAHIITAERPATVYRHTYDPAPWAYGIPPDADEDDD